MKKALFAGAVLLAVLAVFFEFALAGYRVTAVLLLAGAACLAVFGLLAGRKTKAARALRASLAAVLALGFVCFLAAEIPVLSDCRSSADTSAQHLIVCGAGVNGSVPSRSMTDRLNAALDWLEENPGSDAVLSGCQGRGEDISEARAMYDWLTARDVDPSRLMLEENAADSYENIANSLDLIAQAEPRDVPAAGRVAILSSEYHLHRLGYMAEKLGCEPVLVAARTGNRLLFVNYAVREAFAMWKAWVFGIE